MHIPDRSDADDGDYTAVAERLLRARAAATPLADYPGRLPTDLDTAYRCQDAAIARWDDRIVGWKVGGISGDWQATLGESRLVGPTFARDLRFADADAEVAFPVFEGGFAAVEAEIVFRMAVDQPLRADTTADEALAMVDAVFAGVETAGSPMARINELGPTAVVSDFGNNFGLIVGAELSMEALLREPIRCDTLIDGEVVGEYVLQNGLQGPADALAFAMRRLAQRHWPLRRGDFITTGALTGIHDIRAGQRAIIRFENVRPIVCRAVAFKPEGVVG